MDIEDLNDVISLIDNDGQITIGRMGPHRCVAVANDKENMIAALVRQEGETIGNLLIRLDPAINDGYENEIFTDEINRI
jgi:hypothetical protein